MNGLASAIARAVLLLTALSTGRPLRAAEPCAVPTGWDLGEMAAATPPYGTDGKVYLLAWQILEDDRPFRVEEALVLKHLASNGPGDAYHLARLNRDPADKGSTWSLARTHVSPESGSDEPGRMLFHSLGFSHRPTNREIYAALTPDQVRWNFEPEEGWTRTASRVCERNWRASIGEAPTQGFQP